MTEKIEFDTHITLTREKQWAFGSEDVDVYINDELVGYLVNGGYRQFGINADEIKLQLRHRNKFIFLQYKSSPISISDREMQEYEYNVRFGINNFTAVLIYLLLAGGVLLGLFYNEFYFILSLIALLYFIGYRFLNKKHYLYAQKVMKVNSM